MIPLIVTSFSNTGLEAYIAVIYTIQILLRATWLRFIVAARPNNDIFIVSILGVLRCQMGEITEELCFYPKSRWLCCFIRFISGDIAFFPLYFFLVTTLVPIGWTFSLRRNRYRYPHFSKCLYMILLTDDGWHL